MNALYNEIDPYASAWLENLAARNLIAPGTVDRRSVADLRAADVAGRGQRHFFAGIGVWSAAARAAGWPDDCDLWTGSCPCQPFSAAGRGAGLADARHLWPEWFRLIRECRPAVVVGEQVASPAGLGWLDAVFADLEGAGYACGAIDFGAASVGAPHQRQRIYFVAVADGLEGRLHVPQREARRTDAEAFGRGEARLVDHAGSARSGRHAGAVHRAEGEGSREWSEPRGVADVAIVTGDASELADAASSGSREGCEDGGGGQGGGGAPAERFGSADHGGARGVGAVADADEPHPLHGRQPGSWRLVRPTPHATAGFWSPADWIPCSDGKSRPVEPGAFPLAYGATARVGRLRAYGNAIVRPQAQAFLEVVADILAAKGGLT